jgi:hypothetical protein
MSDRSYLSVWLYRVTPEKEAAVRAIIDEYGASPDDSVAPPYFFTAEEARIDTYDEIVTACIAADPGIAILATNDPYPPYLGGLSAYTEELGRYDHDCDGEGNPVFTAKEVLALPPGPLSRRRALGIPWEEAFTGMEGKQ